jgi:general secretion pathway protein D
MVIAFSNESPCMQKPHGLLLVPATLAFWLASSALSPAVAMPADAQDTEQTAEGTAAPAPQAAPASPPPAEPPPAVASVGQLFAEPPVASAPIVQPPLPAAPSLSVAPQSLQTTQAPSAQANGLASAGNDKWTVNVSDASLQSFVQQVAAITGENFIFPAPLNGRVTLASQTPLAKHELQELLRTVLQFYGYSVVKTGKVLAIQPSEQAKKYSLPLDKSGKLSGQQFATNIIPVKFANVSDLIQAMQMFTSDHGIVRGFGDVNAVMVADTAENVQKITQLISTIDNPDNQTVDILPLSYSTVGRIMPLLEKLAPRELAASAKKQAYSPIRIVADDLRNVLIVRGEEAERLRMRTLIQQLDKPMDHEGQTRVIYLQNADAKDTAEMLKDFIKMPPSEGNPQASTLTIRPNIALNALVVRGPQAMMEEVEQVVAQIDIAPAQVLIEAVIVEVTDDINNALGFEYAAGDAAVKGTLATASLNANNNIAAFINSLDIDPRTAVLNQGGVTGLFGIRNDFSVLVQALAATSKANLLSTPNLTTLDNVEAKIVVGQNVPFRTGSFTTSSSGSTNPFTTIERQDVGITLKVTPQINAENRVKLKVEQEVSSIQPTTTSGAADLITNKRTINTTILADNAGTIVLGGLITNDVTQSQSKVPLLGDIPVVGELFQSSTQTDKKRNLLVFLRPTVIRNKQDIAQVNARKFGGLWELSVGSHLPSKAPGSTAPDPSLDGYYSPSLAPSQLPHPLPWLRKDAPETPVAAAPAPSPAASPVITVAPLAAPSVP